MESYRVHLGREDLVFSAAHFITYGGGCCEALHGHNYRVSVTLEGEPDPHGLVVDFLVLQEVMEGLVDRLDHRTLLPAESAEIEVRREGGSVLARQGDAEYRFPEEDVVLLPVDNTTAERLASHLAGRLLEELEAAGAGGVERLELEVEESFGQAASVLLRPGGEP